MPQRFEALGFIPHKGVSLSWSGVFLVLFVKNKLLPVLLSITLVTACLFLPLKKSENSILPEPAKAEAIAPAAVPLLVGGAALGSAIVAVGASYYGIDIGKGFESLEALGNSFSDFVGTLADISVATGTLGMLNTLGLSGAFDISSNNALLTSDNLILDFLKTTSPDVFFDCVSSSGSASFPVIGSSSQSFNFVVDSSCPSISYPLTFLGFVYSTSYHVTSNTVYLYGVPEALSLFSSAGAQTESSLRFVYSAGYPIYALNFKGTSVSIPYSSSSSSSRDFYLRSSSYVYSSYLSPAAAAALGADVIGGTDTTSLKSDVVLDGATEQQTAAIDAYLSGTTSSEDLAKELIDVLNGRDAASIVTNPDVLNPSIDDSLSSSKSAGGVVIGGTDWVGGLASAVQSGALAIDAAINAVITALNEGSISLVDAAAALASIVAAFAGALVTGFDGWTFDSSLEKLRSINWKAIFPICLYWDCLEMFDSLSYGGSGWDYHIVWYIDSDFLNNPSIDLDVSACLQLSSFVKAVWIASAAVGFMFWFASTFIGVAVSGDKKAEKDEKKTSKGGGD